MTVMTTFSIRLSVDFRWWYCKVTELLCGANSSIRVTQVEHSRVMHLLDVVSQVTCSMKDENSVLGDECSLKATSRSRTF